MGRRCEKCLIRDDQGVLIEEDNVCEYCCVIGENRSIIDGIGDKEVILRDRLALFRDKGEYDCIVGLSGGKDSSYMVYRLKSHYHARVLAYTNDNGFLTRDAIDNIEGIVKDFGVDHVWMRPGKDYLREIYRSNLKKESWPCTACVHMGESAIWKLAYEKRIPFIISGRTPEQILRRPDSSFFKPGTSMIMNNLSPYDKHNVLLFADMIGRRIRSEREWLLKDKRFWSNEIYMKESTIPGDFAPEYLSFFLFEPHDDLGIMEVLEKETSWRNRSKIGILSHLDCEAHDAAGYLFHKKNGYPFVSLEASSLIRLGRMNEQEAEKIIRKEKKNASIAPMDSIRALSRVAGMHPLELFIMPDVIKVKRSLKKTIKSILKKVAGL